MSMQIHGLALLSAGVLLLGLTGCGSGSSSSSSSSSSATLNLSVTDTPVDGAQSVVVAFTGVVLNGPNGEQSFTFNTEKKIDLVQVQGTSLAPLLNGATIDAGNYQWIRLDIDTNNTYIITSTGAQYPLTIPSGSQTGLKLVSGFTVAQGSLADFAIDFNLRQSITMSKHGTVTSYMLKPTLRLIDILQVGSVIGTVSGTLNIGGTLITDTICSPAVYVYPGVVTVLNGFNVSVGGGTTPLASATVSLDNKTGSYDYTVGFLAPGTYTLAVTCAADDVTGTPSLAFSPVQNATLTDNAIATVNF